VYCVSNLHERPIEIKIVKKKVRVRPERVGIILLYAYETAEGSYTLLYTATLTVLNQIRRN